MTNPSTPTPEAGWIEWKGGECPVEPTARVDIDFGRGELYLNQDPRDWCWSHVGYAGDDIIAYRLSDRLADERSEPADPSSSEAKIQALEARVKALEGGLRRTLPILSDRAAGGRMITPQDYAGLIYDESRALLGSDGRDDG